MENKIVLKVSSKSNPNSVAGAIAGLSASGFYDLTVRPMKKENQ